MRLYRFSDGWFVTDAQDASLIGGRLVALDDTPVEEVCAALWPYLNHDNDTDLLARYGGLMSMPRMTHALGLTASPDRTTLRLVSRDGAEQAVEVEPISQGQFRAWAGGRGSNQPPRDERVLWLSDPNTAWWIRPLEAERTLYVQFNQVGSTGPGGQSIGALGDEIVRAFEELELERVVVDARLNGGGDNTTFPPLIEALAASEAVNQKGRLYCLAGRHTFSAAGNFVTVFERDLNSILVGEPTGGGPNQYGDARSVPLPNHPDLTVRLSTRYHEFDPAHPERLTHEPHLAVGLSSADYFEGRDPVLQAALDHPIE